MNMFFPGFGDESASEEVIDLPIKDLIDRLIPATLGPASSDILGSSGKEAGLSRRAAECQEIWAQTAQRNLEAVFLFAAQVARPKEVPESLPEHAWLMLFMAHARFAATESQQRAWGEVLGSEVSTPGSIGRRTLLLLSSLEDWELDLFRQFSAFAFAFESGWRFLFEEDLVRREMWSYNRECDLTHHWVELGLLATDKLHAHVSSLRGLEIAYGDKRWEILPASESLHTDSLSPASNEGFRYRKFTATGQELAGALKAKVFNGYARNVISALNGVSGFNYVLKDSEPKS